MVKYEIFRRSVEKLAAESGLDAGAVYFILKDILNDAEKRYYAALNEESLRGGKEAEGDAESVCKENVGELPQ